MRALKASIPPYFTEYRGPLTPLMTSGRCLSASSSHVVTCARMSLTDQFPVTPDFIISVSDRPACDSRKSRHAFLLVFRGEQRVEHAALEAHAFGQGRLEGAVDAFLRGVNRRQAHASDGL